MPRKFLNKFLPGRKKIQKLSGKWYLRPFKELILDPALWHVNRHGTCAALAMGLFICCLPIPGHTPLAILGAFLWRLNLPLAVAAVWLNNPLTAGAIYYGSYKLGAILLRVRLLPFPHHFSLDWLFAEFSRIWAPLWLGCIIVGILLALVGFVVLSIAWQISIRARWRKRRQERAAR
ncbi:MAG: DUF2062 domain-containing protein [Gammaproteobacteria bacterium]